VSYNRLTTEAANKIFHHAKERVYRIIKLSSTQKLKLSQKSAISSKDNALQEILMRLELEHIMEPVLGTH
jgi:hypothetical protein